jgi:hypothetical protein
MFSSSQVHQEDAIQKFILSVLMLISGHSPSQAGSNRLFPWRNVSAFRLRCLMTMINWLWCWWTCNVWSWSKHFIWASTITVSHVSPDPFIRLLSTHPVFSSPCKQAFPSGVIIQTTISFYDKEFNMTKPIKPFYPPLMPCRISVDVVDSGERLVGGFS